MGRSTTTAFGWITLAPAACIVHCALAPVLVIAAPGIGASTGLEWGFLGATVVFATPSMAFHHRRHSRAAPLLVVLVGIALWLASLLGAFDPVAIEVSTAVAASIVTGALIWSARLTHAARARRCECSNCQSDS